MEISPVVSSSHRESVALGSPRRLFRESFRVDGIALLEAPSSLGGDGDALRNSVNPVDSHSPPFCAEKTSLEPTRYKYLSIGLQPQDNPRLFRQVTRLIPLKSLPPVSVARVRILSENSKTSQGSGACCLCKRTTHPFRSCQSNPGAKNRGNVEPLASID